MRSWSKIKTIGSRPLSSQEVKELDDSLDLEMIEEEFYSDFSKSNSLAVSKAASGFTLRSAEVFMPSKRLPRISERTEDNDILDSLEKEFMEIQSRNSLNQESKQSEPSWAWAKVTEPEELFSKGFSQLRQSMPQPRPSTINFEDEKEVEHMLDELEKEMEIEDLETRPEPLAVGQLLRSSSSQKMKSQASVEDEICDLLRKSQNQKSSQRGLLETSHFCSSQQIDIEKLESEFFSSLDETKLRMASGLDNPGFPLMEIKACSPFHIEKQIEYQIQRVNSGLKPLIDRRSAKAKDDPGSLSQQLKKLSQELEIAENQVEVKVTADFGVLFKKKRSVGTKKQKRKSSQSACLDKPPNVKLYKTKLPENLGTTPKCEVDRAKCETWIYLLHRQFRRYQFEITETCLFNNTLVCLPTGMGKTFIAANIIYNYYRWFPTGKIFFLAATRPLVTQQIKCVEEIEGIDFNDATELTGGDPHNIRAEKYSQKRIFFQTPQTLQNDLERGIVDLTQIVLVVYGRSCLIKTRRTRLPVNMPTAKSASSLKKPMSATDL